MPTFLKRTKHVRSQCPGSSTEASTMQVSASSLSKKDAHKILKRWAVWKPLVMTYFLEGVHGAQCSRRGCPCGSKYNEIEGIRLSHEHCVLSMLRAGVSMILITKHNLDSPMIPEIDRDDWVQEFILRQQDRNKRRRQHATKEESTADSRHARD